MSHWASSTKLLVWSFTRHFIRKFDLISHTFFFAAFIQLEPVPPQWKQAIQFCPIKTN